MMIQRKMLEPEIGDLFNTYFYMSFILCRFEAWKHGSTWTHILYVVLSVERLMIYSKALIEVTDILKHQGKDIAARFVHFCYELKNISKMFCWTGKRGVFTTKNAENNIKITFEFTSGSDKWGRVSQQQQ